MNGQCHGHDTSPAAEQWSRIIRCRPAEKSLSGHDAIPRRRARALDLSARRCLWLWLSMLLSSSLAVTLPASHEQSSAAALSTPLCFFSPNVLPCSFSFAPVSLPLRTCNALALIVTPLSSPSFPLYSPSSFSLLIVVWVFRTPYGSAGQLPFRV